MESHESATRAGTSYRFGAGGFTSLLLLLQVRCFLKQTLLEVTFSFSAMLFWVIAWFVIVICVTTLNKVFFTSLKCPYPVSITMVVFSHTDNAKIHMLSCYVYSSIMKHLTPSLFHYRPLRQSELKSLFLVSVIFIVNIILSNSSLKYNSLALDQASRLRTHRL